MFHPEVWDAPDAQEQQMIDGCPSMRPWPESVHRWHALRRWEQAKHAYRQQHEEFAVQELEDLIAEERQAREAERRRYGRP